MTSNPGEIGVPRQSPLFHAIHADRYDRQSLIADYEESFACRLVVMIDAIFAPSVTLFEELIYDATPEEDLHLLLASPGGDGEAAVRLVRSAQARCRRLTVIVPDQAKSAATLLTLGAHQVLMSPSSDLGPIDPQFQLQDGDLVSAKDLIDAVDDAARKVQAAPDTYPIYASLLIDVTALKVQQARSALARTADQLKEALRSNPDRGPEEIASLVEHLTGPLIEEPRTHSALFGCQEAQNAGLPVSLADLNGTQWQTIWRLWTKYFALDQGLDISRLRVYEGKRSSQIGQWA